MDRDQPELATSDADETSDDRETPAEASDSDFETVGTGSFFAIGCTVLTLIAVLAGVALFIFRQAT